MSKNSVSGISIRFVSNSGFGYNLCLEFGFWDRRTIGLKFGFWVQFVSQIRFLGQAHDFVPTASFGYNLSQIRFLGQAHDFVSYSSFGYNLSQIRFLGQACICLVFGFWVQSVSNCGETWKLSVHLYRSMFPCPINSSLF